MHPVCAQWGVQRLYCAKRSSENHEFSAMETGHRNNSVFHEHTFLQQARTSENAVVQEREGAPDGGRATEDMLSRA